MSYFEKFIEYLKDIIFTKIHFRRWGNLNIQINAIRHYSRFKVLRRRVIKLKI